MKITHGHINQADHNFVSLAGKIHTIWQRPPGTNFQNIGVHLRRWYFISSFQKWLMKYMMTSSNGNIFRVTGHLCGEFTGPRWIPHTKAMQWRGALMFTFICARINGWVNNREAGDLRRNRAHYDVIVMTSHNITVRTVPLGRKFDAVPMVKDLQ